MLARMSRTFLYVCLGALAVLGLPMCQQFDGAIPAGMVRAVDSEADAMIAQAEAYGRQGKVGKEIKLLEKVATQHQVAPNADKARFLLGKAYESKGDYREAFKQYSRLIDRYPQSALYRDALNRQLSMAMRGAQGKLTVPVFWGAWHSNMESDKVVEWLRYIIDKAPYNDMAATASSLLGKFLVEKRRYEEARIEYARLVEKYPDSSYAPEAQLMVAQLWASNRTRGENNLVNLTNAREAYEEFSLRFPNHKDAHKALAQVSNMKRLMVQQQLDVGKYYLYRSNEYQSAVFCFEDVVRQKSVNPEAAAEAAQLLAKARAAAANSK